MNQNFPIALHVVGFLAARAGEPLTSDTLAATYGTSPVVLRRVLRQLQDAGLITTRRGVGGGSLLAQDPAEIPLRAVYEAVVDDTELLPRAAGGGHGRIAQTLWGFLDELCGEAERALLARLESVTVAEMDREVRTRLGCGPGPVGMD
ncbi:MAG: Rrf2 family transcriptional regulator [Planctomycetota bacterium]